MHTAVRISPNNGGERKRGRRGGRGREEEEEEKEEGDEEKEEDIYIQQVPRNPAPRYNKTMSEFNMIVRFGQRLSVIPGSSKVHFITILSPT